LSLKVTLFFETFPIYLKCGKCSYSAKSGHILEVVQDTDFVITGHE